MGDSAVGDLGGLDWGELFPRRNVYMFIFHAIKIEIEFDTYL